MLLSPFYRWGSEVKATSLRQQISGPGALKLLAPGSDYYWPPGTLDIVSPTLGPLSRLYSKPVGPFSSDLLGSHGKSEVP